jgi:hypothetical protein
METPNSYLHERTEFKRLIANALTHADKISRHAKFVERATAAQDALGRTLEFINRLEKSLQRPEGQIDFVDWVKEVYPVINCKRPVGCPWLTGWNM